MKIVSDHVKASRTAERESLTEQLYKTADGVDG